MTEFSNMLMIRFPVCVLSIQALSHDDARADSLVGYRSLVVPSFTTRHAAHTPIIFPSSSGLVSRGSAHRINTRSAPVAVGTRFVFTIEGQTRRVGMKPLTTATSGNDAGG